MILHDKDSSAAPDSLQWFVGLVVGGVLTALGVLAIWNRHIVLGPGPRQTGIASLDAGWATLMGFVLLAAGWTLLQALFGNLPPRKRFAFAVFTAMDYALLGGLLCVFRPA